MSDDTYYITTHEAALAVVATAMKKSRLRLDSLIMTSILGGMLFSAGGMLHFLVQAGFQDQFTKNPGIVHLLQGAVYPIGLFYVVLMGTDLYNSNVLFFTVGMLRGAVSFLDLVLSWTVSFFFNLAGNLFVVYVLCYVSKSMSDDNYRAASKEFLDAKLSLSFGENLLKGIPCNFLVALAIYLQLMTKPIHVKFLMLFFPVFTFVSMGFNHVVADMFIIPLALFNNSAGWTVGQYIWKSMIPSAIGNAIGGAAFGIMVPWYLHLYVVEMDKKKLNLPEYDERDEQPEQGMDSRVVRVPSVLNSDENSSETLDDSLQEKAMIDDMRPMAYNPVDRVNTRDSMRSSSGLSRFRTGSSSIRLRHTRTRNSSELIRSPKGVFPVYNMGEPYAKERRLTDAYGAGKDANPEDGDGGVHDDDGADAADEYLPNDYDPEEHKMSENLRRIISRKPSSTKDIESQQIPPQAPQAPQQQISPESRPVHRPAPRPTFFKSSFQLGSSSANNDYDSIARTAKRAGLTRKSIHMSDDVAGIHPQSIYVMPQGPETAGTRPAAAGERSRTNSKPKPRNFTGSSSESRPHGPNANSADVHDEIESIDSSNSGFKSTSEAQTPAEQDREDAGV